MSTSEPAPRYPVRTEKNVLIAMSDGTLIAADLHRPDAPGRFPVIMEYLPYRKDDVMAYRQQRHHYFAARGFACAWVDIRGTGASGGVIVDEYAPQEQDDALEMIAWLAAQPWSNGNVGMTGISWGGFNAIQVAMRRPPALKAIIPAYATDDRYTDDVHYYGGAFRGYELLEYPLQMVGMNALPPHPEIAGARWADLWAEHLQAEPWVLTWIEQQQDGDYWRHGSLRPHYDAITAATLMICGWADGYRNWPLRTFAALRCPKRLIMGPWGHEWPDRAYPGPNVDYLDLCARWFGRWLGGEEPTAQDEPPITIYVQHYHPPAPILAAAPGAWRAEDEWPIPGAATRTLYLGDGVLDATPPITERCDVLDYVPTVGVTVPFDAMGGSAPGLQPLDQRADEAYALVYTTPPLDADLEVIGYPLAVLHVSASAEVAFFSVKISDVAPDGRSTFVTRGLLNATRRDSLRDPTPLVPGQVYELRIELDCCAWVFPAGHRLRLAIAGSDWPNIWPAPLPSTHTVVRSPVHPSRVEVPVAPPATRPAPVFGPPPALVTLSTVEGSADAFQITENFHDQTVTARYDSGLSRAAMPADQTTLTTRWTWELTTSRPEPARSTAHGTIVYTLSGIGSVTRVESMVDVSSDRTSFHTVVTLTIHVNDAVHLQRHWTRTTRRRLL